MEVVICWASEDMFAKGGGEENQRECRLLDEAERDSRQHNPDFRSMSHRYLT